MATDRGGPSPSPGTTTGGASSATATPSPTGTVPPPRPAPPIVDPKAAVTASCVTTATTLSKAVTRWNAAVRARRTSALRAAAAGLKSAAKVVRVQARASKDRTFAKAAGAVATELDRAAASYAANRTVSGTSLNKAQQAMVSYCQKVI
ncbi:MAG TPA: hypothetical protein VFJ97_02705 [Dermatophilaceae bacterium]|nr:hypothetical protein [Dermatophilaceae bacterium]